MKSVASFFLPADPNLRRFHDGASQAFFLISFAPCAPVKDYLHNTLNCSNLDQDADPRRRIATKAALRAFKENCHQSRVKSFGLEPTEDGTTRSRSVCRVSRCVLYPCCCYHRECRLSVEAKLRSRGGVGGDSGPTACSRWYLWRKDAEDPAIFITRYKVEVGGTTLSSHSPRSKLDCCIRRPNRS